MKSMETKGNQWKNNENKTKTRQQRESKEKQKQTTKYNNKNKEQFLNFPMLATAVVETYFNSLVEEKRKN